MHCRRGYIKGSIIKLGTVVRINAKSIYKIYPGNWGLVLRLYNQWIKIISRFNCFLFSLEGRTMVLIVFGFDCNSSLKLPLLI